MSYQTERKKVNGLGSAKEGVQHWSMQRITSVVLALLAPFFVLRISSLLGKSFDEVQAGIGHPVTAILMIAFIGTTVYHLKLGMQVVIEDYIHNKALGAVLFIGNILFCGFIGIAGIFAIAKIAFNV